MDFDLVYGVAPWVQPSDGRLFVDFNLTRLARLARCGTVDGRCAELAEIEGIFPRICINVLPFTPQAQIRRDIAAAARLAGPAGEVAAAMGDSKLENGIRRLLAEAFASVTKSRDGRRKPAPLLARSPLPGGPGCGHDRLAATGRVAHPHPAGTGTLAFATHPGLFAYREVDAGTRLLLDWAPVRAGAAVFDFACGYGPIGVWAAARGARVLMSDNDARAVACARRNLAQNGQAGEVLLADGVPHGLAEGFDLVLTNPPTHAGSATLRETLAGLYRMLRPRGELRLVVRERLNYEQWLDPLAPVACLVRRDGYKVLKVGGQRRP